jgi:hypothetical protein
VHSEYTNVRFLAVYYKLQSPDQVEIMVAMWHLVATKHREEGWVVLSEQVSSGTAQSPSPSPLCPLNTVTRHLV